MPPMRADHLPVPARRFTLPAERPGRPGPWIAVGEGLFEARRGWRSVRTPLENVVSVHPVRSGWLTRVLARGLSLNTGPGPAVRIGFGRPVRACHRSRRYRSLTVVIPDPHELADAVGRPMSSGPDLR